MENNISKVAAALEKLTNATVELKRLGVIRSRKPVSTDYSEWLVRQLFGGSLAPSKNQPGWDIDLGEEKVQVKVSFNPDSTANRWSYIKDPSFYDSLILIVLSDDYKVLEFYKVPSKKVASLKKTDSQGLRLNWNDIAKWRLSKEQIPNYDRLSILFR